MDSDNSKIVVYLLILFAVVALLGMAIVRINNAAQAPGNQSTVTQAEKLKTLSDAAGVKTPVDNRFINNAETRENATKEAEEAVSGGL